MITTWQEVVKQDEIYKLSSLLEYLDLCETAHSTMFIFSGAWDTSSSCAGTDCLRRRFIYISIQSKYTAARGVSKHWKQIKK